MYPGSDGGCALRTTLVPSFRDLADAIDDFRNSSLQSCDGVLERLVHALDEEPLAGFLHAVLPKVDFAAWLEEAQKTIGSMVGSGALNWPQIAQVE
jgi:hypothetical protein